ncbi:hypothetical protein QQ045_015978 [Rhodiola kirilowii]
MVEFLFLMFALDKLYYSPLGNFMDERDAMIKGKLSEVKDTSAEIKAMEEHMAAIMRAARGDIGDVEQDEERDDGGSGAEDCRGEEESG